MEISSFQDEPHIQTGVTELNFWLRQRRDVLKYLNIKECTKFTDINANPTTLYGTNVQWNSWFEVMKISHNP